MSQSEEVVRRLLSPHEGTDVLPPIRATLEGLGPNPQRAAVIATLEQDPAWSHYDPDIEWDMSATGVGVVTHGVRELAVWWGLWVAAWNRHAYSKVEYKDLGEWVLTVADVDAEARGNHQLPPIKMFQIWKLSAAGKVTVMRAFLTEEAARKAAGQQPAPSPAP